MENTFKDKVILITGGTGSIGQHLVKKLTQYSPKIIRILDNRESELFFMEEQLKEYDNLRFLVGDIRDKERLILATQNVDIIFHCAALKHVKSSEFNPFEAKKTNIDGVQNIIDAALANNVEKVIYTSSDKAVNPHNTMGATKLIGEKLITAANYYKGEKRTTFASVRFGNVMESNGSVIPLWKKQIKEKGKITITDPTMTRFMMSMDQATTLVLKCAQLSRGGEVFTLKMPSININDLADIIIENSGKQTEKEIIGLKPGETKFEELMTEHEAQRSLELEDMYIIPSSFEELFETKSFEYPGSIPIKTKIYNSKFQKVSLKEEIRKMLRKEENIVAIIQARMGSTRLPNKTLELIEGKPLLQHVIERIKECKNINKIVIATTKEPNDDQIEIFAKQNNISIFRGNTENVLERYYKAAKEYNASTIVRITADDPFKDPEIIDNIIEQIKKDKTLDYVSNTIKPTFPEGIDTEVLTFKALEKSWKDAHSEFEKEHVTQHIIKNPQKFNIINVLNNEDISKLRWTIDFQEDLDFTREVYKRLYHHNKIFKMRDILQLLEREPYLKEINKNIKQRNWEENV